MSGLPSDPSLLGVARVIQLALTPIFLLSGIAALLNVFSGRLARVADQVDLVSHQLADERGEEVEHLKLQLASLRRRSHILDAAMVLGGVGGVATGLSVLTLFIGALNRGGSGSDVLLFTFGLGVVCTVAAVGAFLIESLLSSRGVRREVTRAEQSGGRRLPLPLQNLWRGRAPHP